MEDGTVKADDKEGLEIAGEHARPPDILDFSPAHHVV